MHSSAFGANAQSLACGPEGSFCKGALESSYQDVLRSDSCAIETHSADNEHHFDYNMWLPSYASTLKRGSAFLNASNDTNRFAAKQVNQESFLQGRGQVSSNPGCKGSNLVYLPEEVFQGDKEHKERAPWEMHLFAQPTLVPRSCASITELDMLKRMKPLAESYQGRFTPLVGNSSHESGGKRKYEEGVTLSSKKYETFADLAKKDRYA